VTAGFALDAGAFVALERGDTRLVGFARDTHRAGTPLVTSAGVVAQVWRGGANHQVPVAFLLRRTEVIDLTDAQARLVGKVLGTTGTSDPVDAHIALIAGMRGWPLLTSDPKDLRAIDDRLDLIEL
jgi:predicted nucleic acid-binding protein